MKKNILVVIAISMVLLSGCAKNMDVQPDEKVTDIINKAKNGDGDSQSYLADDYYKNPPHKNDQQSFYWMQKAAENNVYGAPNNLAIYYSQGIGTKADQQKAIYWFKQGVDQGDAFSMSALGVRYYLGFGVKQDQRQAVKLFQKAYLYDSREKGALYMLAKCYLKGEGVKQDEKKGIQALTIIGESSYQTKSTASKNAYVSVFVAYERGLILNQPMKYPVDVTQDMILQAKKIDERLQKNVSVKQVVWM